MMIAKRSRRRRLGIYYTPPALIGPILDAALDPILAEMGDEASCAARLATLRIIDPACGSGRFLIAAWRRLARRIEGAARPANRVDLLRAAAASLHGIDIDPQAGLRGARLLRAECGRGPLAPRDFSNWFVLGDALLDECAGEACFDLVLGNPPFVDSESMCEADRGRRPRLAARYETARGNWDLAALFVERAVQLVQPGGRIGLVLPRRLFASDHARRVHRLMERQTIESIRLNAPDAFEDAAVKTVSVVMRRAVPCADHAICIMDADACSWSALQRGLRLLPPGHWSAILSRPPVRDRRRWAERESMPVLFASDVTAALRGRPRLRDMAFVGDGATTAEAYVIRDAIIEAGECGAPAAPLINTGTIDPFVKRWGSRPTRYLRRAWIRPVVPLEWLDEHLPRRAAQSRSPKVLVAGLAGRIEAVVDEVGALCGKSAVQIIPRDPAVTHALCAWLNSTPVNALYRLLFESRGFGARSMHLGPRQIEQLPLWPPFEPNGAEAIEELAALSRRMHSLAAGDAPQSGANLQPEAMRAALDRIDEIAAALLRAGSELPPALSATDRRESRARDRVP